MFIDAHSFLDTMQRIIHKGVPFADATRRVYTYPAARAQVQAMEVTALARLERRAEARMRPGDLPAVFTSSRLNEKLLPAAAGAGAGEERPTDEAGLLVQLRRRSLLLNRGFQQRVLQVRGGGGAPLFLRREKGRAGGAGRGGFGPGEGGGQQSA